MSKQTEQLITISQLLNIETYLLQKLIVRWPAKNQEHGNGILHQIIICEKENGA